MNLRVLFVEDSPDDAELMLRRLRDAGFEPQWDRVETEAALRAAFVDQQWELALVDYNLPGFGGAQALATMAEIAPDVPAITVSGAIDEDTAVTTLTAGAVDYVLKDNLARLVPAVRRAVEGADLRRRHRRAAQAARLAQFSVDHAPVAMVTVDPDGTILYANPAQGALRGVPGRDLVGQKIWGTATGWSEAGWQSARDTALRDGIWEHEIEVLRPDGGRRLLDAMLSVLEYDGRPLLIGWGRDMTDRRTAEEQARTNERLYRRIVDVAGEGIWVFDADDRLTFANPQMARILGYGLNDMIGRKDSDFMFEEDAAVHEAERRARREGRPGSYERRFRSKAGDEVWLAANSVAEIGPAGDYSGSFSMCTDITERRRGERALRASETHFRAFFEQASVGMATTSPEMRFISVNGTLCRLLGYSREELAELTWAGLTHPDDLAADVDDFADVLSGKSDGYTTDKRFVCKSGAIIHATLAVRAVRKADASLDYMAAVLVDITERKRAEEALLAEKANLTAIIDASPVAMLVFNEQKSVVRANVAAAVLARGATADALLDCGPGGSLQCGTALGCVHRDDDPRGCGFSPDCPLCPLRNGLAAVLADGGAARGVELALELERDGEMQTVWLLVGLEPVLISGARHVVVALDEITDRVRAVAALKESEQRFAAFADHLPGELWIRDAESRCLYANPQISADLGMDVDQVVGSLPHDLWEGETLDQVLAEHARALSGEVVDVVREWPLPDGRGRFFHMLAFPFGGDDGVTMVGAVEIDVTDQHEAEEKVRRQADQLRRTVEGAVLAMSHVVEMRDPYTAGHERRVSELCAAIGRELGLENEIIEGLRLAGLIHDIGKIAVPAEILAKPGRLSAVEFNLINQHAPSGYEILAPIDFERPVAAIVLQHHERLDGSGYPQGLASDDILPEAKILSVADVVEAMSSHRPYRPALGTDAALAEIREYSGVKYDADVVAACSRLILEKGFVFSD